MKKDKFSEWDRFYNLCQNFTDPDEAFEIYKSLRERRIKPYAKKRTPGGRWKNYNPRDSVPVPSIQLPNRIESESVRNASDEQPTSPIGQGYIKDPCTRAFCVSSCNCSKGETETD